MAVARAGICAALPARTAVLGAANPVGGGWNRAKTVQQNLGLSGAMLSRFDLLFVMRDAPDAALDQRLSEHVLAMYSGEIHMLEPSWKLLHAAMAITDTAEYWSVRTSDNPLAFSCEGSNDRFDKMRIALCSNVKYAEPYQRQ